MRKGALILVSLMLLGLLVGSTVGLTASKIFNRPITIVCFAAAGGGTDLVDRALAEGMKEYLGVQVNVINMTGPGVATDYVWQKPHDGYTLYGVSESGLTYPVIGAHKTTTKDWEFFIAGGSPGVVMVKPDAPYKTFGDLVAAAKAKPGSIKVGASVPGGMWNTKWLVLCKAAGIKTNVLGFTGSAPSMTAGLTGEVDVVHVAVAEGLSYMQAGKLRPLCVSELEPYDIPGVGKAPAIVDYIPEAKKVLPMPQWLGFAVPTDTPRPILTELTNAYKFALKTKAVRDFLSPAQAYVLYGYYGSKAKQVAEELEAKFCWTLWEMGTAKVNPEDMGIPQPED